MKAIYLKDKTGNKVVTVPYYRIGDLFLTTIATNPSSYLGGKWELFGPGRCLVCVDASQTEFNSVKKTGGSKTVTLNINQIPSHSHSTPTTLRYDITSTWWIGGTGGTTIAVDNKATGSTGGGQAHNNLQPFITCYVWIRTA